MKLLTKLILSIIVFSCGFGKTSNENVISKNQAKKMAGIANADHAVSFAIAQQGNNSVLAQYIDAVMKAEEEKCKNTYPMDNWRKTKIYSQVVVFLEKNYIHEETNPEGFIEYFSGEHLFKSIEKGDTSSQYGYPRVYLDSETDPRIGKFITKKETIPSKNEYFCDRFDYRYYHDLTKESEKKLKEFKNGNKAIDVEFEVVKIPVKKRRL